jgi:excisionase family DNA binding protein
MSKPKAKATRGNPPKKMLTVPEAARLIGIDPRTLRAAVRNGQVKAVTLASAVRVSRAEVDRLLAGAKS